VRELDERQDLTHLAALELADEVPASAGSAMLSTFAARSWARFSPEQRQAGRGEHADVLAADVPDGV
jgi:hypothetical protein